MTEFDTSELSRVLDPDTLVSVAKLPKYWGCLPDSKKEIFYAKKGVASEAESPAMTVYDLFVKTVEKAGDKPALKVETGLADLENLPKKDGKPQIPPSEPVEEWKTWTYKDYFEESKQLAKALIAAGFKRHDSVNIFGFNHPAWLMSQQAAMLAGGKAAGIYPSDTADQIKYKCDHANGSIVAVDGQKTFDKVKDVVSQLPYIKAIVCWGTLQSKEDLFNQNGDTVIVREWSEFLDLGSKVSDEELGKIMKSLEPGDPACLIYTSGTTGNPKAVILSHDAILFTAKALFSLDIGGFGDDDNERTLSYLPLSHVAGMMMDVVAPLLASSIFNGYVTVHFARSYDLKAGSLVERLQAVHPTLFFGVPRVWEKMAEKLQAAMSQATGVKGALARWSMRQGRAAVFDMAFDHDKPAPPGRKHRGFLYGIADSLVLSKVRMRLGLHKCKYSFSGAAPIGVETLSFLASFGLNINEVYGQSEGSAGGSFATDPSFVWGTVGPAFPGCEVRIFDVDPADLNKKVPVPPAKNLFKAEEKEQGEICIRSRGLMTGYMANPRLGENHVKEIEQKNREAIDNEGFLHSGDKGALSKYGFLKITGRFKEIIIGAGGENIAPTPIEDHIKKICPYISNVMMIGDKRKFNICFVTLKLQGATGDQPGTDKLDLGEFKNLGVSCTTIQEAIKDEKLIKLITDKIKETNADGEVVISNAAKIQKFTILPRDFSVENEELTPTLKLKRAFVADKFEKVIDKVYESSANYVEFPMEQFQLYYK